MDNAVFYPICDIIPDDEGHGMIIGNNGSLTYAVRLSFPEVYSLYKDEIERFHAVYMQAFSHMPHMCINRMSIAVCSTILLA